MIHANKSNRCAHEVKLAGIHIARLSTVPFYVVAQLKNQIVFLGKKGIRVSVVASDEPELLEFTDLAGVRPYAVNISRSIAPIRDVFALCRLMLFFRHQDVDISHSTTPKAGLLSAIGAFLANVPIRLHTFTGQPWVTMTGFKRWVARACDKLIGKLNTRCYTDSPSQRDFLIREGIVDAGKLFVIGHGSLAGVDTRRFDRHRFASAESDNLRQSLGIPADARVLLFVGRITADKGVRELLQAFRQICGEHGDVHLVFVGHFDAESGVASSVTREDVENIPNVHIVDYTPIPEAYMAIADILCLPSYREGFGTVVIEAAAMGLPTVGSEIYGLTDAVVNGETGLLVPPRDAGALAAALAQLLADTDLRHRMGQAARQRVLDHFDADRINLKIMQEYQILIKEAGIAVKHG